MKTQITYNDLPPSDTEFARQDIEKVAERLDRKTKVVSDDAKYLRVSVEAIERTKEYGVTLSLSIPSSNLVATAQKATFSEALRAAEKKLEQEVEHHFGKLRREARRGGEKGEGAVEEPSAEEPPEGAEGRNVW